MAYTDTYQTFADLLGISVQTTMILLAIISIWTLVWKGFALWKASKRNSKPWFIAILIINTLGILEILYIYIFSELKPKRISKETIKKKK